MHAEPTRWRRATVISVGLHAALALVAWWALGPDDAQLRWYEPHARYTPAQIIPIELPAWQQAEPSLLSAESELPAVELELEPEPEPSPAQRQQPRSRAARASPAHEPAATRGRASVRREGPAMRLSTGREGLAGDGAARAAVDPTKLRGSQTVLAASVPLGQPEGPQPIEQGRPSHDYAFEREGNRWVYHDPAGNFTATLQPDGGVQFKNKLVKVRVGSMPAASNDGEETITLAVDYDAVGVAQVARGKDPSPRAKALLLAATFEMRLQMATEYHAQRLLDQLNGLGDELDGIWRAGGLDVAERKRLLFERWDECQEQGGGVPGFESADASALDERRREVAEAARARILRFIRSVLPPDHEHAYTHAELEQLNQRRASKQAFAPYE